MPVGDPDEDGLRTWHVVGPLRREVNPLTFSFGARVVTHRRWAGRDIFARLVSTLVDRERFATTGDAFESLQVLACSPQLDDDDEVEQPSW